MTEENKPTVDLYAECLRSILAFYDVQIDLDGLIENIPKHKDVLEKKDLGLIAKKIDFKVKSHHLAFSKLEKLNSPVIVLMKDGPCVYFPDTLSQGRFIFPGRHKEEVTFKELKKNYQGIVLVVSPKESKGKLDITHMKRGHSIDWFWKPIVSFWAQYAEIIVCSIFINLLALAVPLYTMNVYDRVVINFAEDTLFVLTSGVIAALIFDLFFKLTRSYILEKIALSTSVKHDYDLMERLVHIKDVDLGLSIGEKSGLFRELQAIREFYATRLVPTLVDMPFFLLFTFVIYMIAPPLAVVPITAALFILVINLLAQIPLNRSTAENFTTTQSKSKLLVELLRGIYTIKVLNAAGFKLLQWKLAAENASETAFSHSILSSIVANLSQLVTQVAYVCIIFLGVYLISDGSLTIGGLIACSIIFSRAVAPVAGFSSVLTRLKQSRDVLETIDKIFQLPHEDIQSRRKGNKGPFKGDILIEDLSYQYPEQARQALYKNNLKIEAGEHIGIIGQTGAGKTTLSKIVAGFITPNEGNIFLDGYVYSSIPETELHRSIGYVPQDPFFFAGTIRENILMGDNSPESEEAIKEIVSMSGLDLVMQQTGEGLDMDVGESGKRLSGGQKQAISIARALIRKPNVLVFDEPTNGMDNALEARVKASLSKFIKDRTFIMITHRTSLLPLIDRLILVDRGRIVADGPRDEIIQKLAGK